MKHVESMIDELLEILNILPAAEVRILLHHARRLKGRDKCERIFRD